MIATHHNELDEREATLPAVPCPLHLALDALDPPSPPARQSESPAYGVRVARSIRCPVPCALCPLSCLPSLYFVPRAPCLRERADIVDVLPTPRSRIHLVLVRAKSPLGPCRHRIDWDSPEDFFLFRLSHGWRHPQFTISSSDLGYPSVPDLDLDHPWSARCL